MSAPGEVPAARGVHAQLGSAVVGRALKAGVGVVLVALVAWWGYGRFYAGPRDRLLREIGTLSEQNESLEGALADEGAVRRRLREIAARGFGGSADQAEHALRTALSAVAHGVGIGDVRVSSDRPVARGNPYTKSRKSSSSLRSLLRDQRDFAVIGARVEGRGTLEQAVTLLAAYQSQAWLARITGFSLKPVGEAREQFDVVIQAQALYVPDLRERGDGVEVVSAEPGLLARVMAVAEKNVFRVPDAPVVVEAAPQVVVAKADPPPAPPPAYHEWRVTGIARGRVGIEAWVVNGRTGEWRTLGLGQSVLGARLIDAQGERAVFEVDGKLCEVFAGQALSDRRLIPEVTPPGQ